MNSYKLYDIKGLIKKEMDLLIIKEDLKNDFFVDNLVNSTSECIILRSHIGDLNMQIEILKEEINSLISRLKN